jgi:hypothetical protein
MWRRPKCSKNEVVAPNEEGGEEEEEMQNTTYGEGNLHIVATLFLFIVSQGGEYLVSNFRI